MTIDEAWLKERADDLQASILFLTRLRVRRRAAGRRRGTLREPPGRFRSPAFSSVSSGPLVYRLRIELGLPAWPAAALSVAATMAVTGCLHEDGLADTADGFGGGRTRELKLDIMRDSRIGTYGVCAWSLSILLRVSALASLARYVPRGGGLDRGARRRARHVAGVHVFRAAGAPTTDFQHAAGQPPRESVIAAAVLGILILALCLGPVLAIAALILLVVVIALLAWLSLAQIDGQTGDVLGALEQVERNRHSARRVALSALEFALRKFCAACAAGGQRAGPSSI